MSIKKQYPTSVQKTKLVELLEADEELRQGKFSSTFTKKVAEERWNMIAHELNSLGGANKTWSDWRKTWQDMKSKTKKKQAFIRRTLNLTGGGPPPPPLSEHETFVLNMMSDVAVVGHGDSKESVVCFKDVMGPITIDETFPPMAPAAASCVNILEPEVPPAASVVVVENEAAMDLEENLEVSKCNNKPKQKKTMAQKRLQKSIDIAASLVQVLQEKNKIRKDYYNSKIYEMKRQSDALIQIVFQSSLSHNH